MAHRGTHFCGAESLRCNSEKKNSCIETEASWLPGEVGPHQHKRQLSKQLVCPVAKPNIEGMWGV